MEEVKKKIPRYKQFYKLWDEMLSIYPKGRPDSYDLRMKRINQLNDTRKLRKAAQKELRKILVLNHENKSYIQRFLSIHNISSGAYITFKAESNPIPIYRELYEF
jgi:hypothetical protein